MLDKKKKYSGSKCKLYIVMLKLLTFKNKKKIPWNPCICTMKQNLIIFSNQLIHGWHEVVQMSAWVLNTHRMGRIGGGQF